MNETFTLAHIAEETTRCNETLSNIFRQEQCEEILNKMEAALKGAQDESKTTIAFIGQYSAGKSSIISALTHNSEIKISAGICTDEVAKYEWNDLLLVDTPGLYTERKEHDFKTMEYIKSASLLVYCITSELFSTITKEDFIRLAYQDGYAPKMFLLVNKMSQESGGNYASLVDYYSQSLNRALAPHCIGDFPHSFLDALDYITASKEQDKELEDMSHFSDFIKELNCFASEKGLLGRYDEPIKIMKDSIREFSAARIEDDNTKNYLVTLTRLETRLSELRHRAGRKYNRIINENIQPINERRSKEVASVTESAPTITEEEFNALMSGCLEQIHKDLGSAQEQDLLDVVDAIKDVLDSNLARSFYESAEKKASFGFHPFEKAEKKKHQQTSYLGDFTDKASFGLLKATTNTGGAKTAGFFLKASEASGSLAHSGILKLGGKLGYKFKPWQAVKLAKGLGNLAKFLGLAGLVLEVGMDVKSALDEKKSDERIADCKLQIQTMFESAGKEVRKSAEKERDSILDALFSDSLASLNAEQNRVILSDENRAQCKTRLTQIAETLSCLENEIFRGVS